MKHFCYNALALDALPVHLLRQVVGPDRGAGGFIFWSFLESFSLSVFCSSFWGAGEVFGGSGVDFGAIWGAFGGHFGHFFGVRGIFENVCFSIVKQYFLRFGRVLDGVFFVLCFWINTFGVLLVVFWVFVGPQGPHGGPNGSLLGTLRDQISAQLATLVAPWFQGGSRAPKRSHFESLWGVFWRYFGVCFVWFFTRNVEVVFQDCGNFRPYFLIKDCKYYLFTCVFMCFAFVYAYSVDVVEAAPPGAAEDHWSCWDMQRRGHHFCCTCVCSSGEYNSCATFFLQCSSLERASRSLAKTGFF